MENIIILALIAGGIFVGITLLMVIFLQRQRSGENSVIEATDKQRMAMGASIAVGAGLGVVYGLAVDNMGLGIGAGVAIGVSIGVALSRRKDEE